jgi:hypothetical protein
MAMPHPRALPAGFIAPCLPTNAPTPSGAEWLHEIKFDGFRVIARKNDKRVKLYSRPGNDLTDRFPFIVEAFAKLRSRSCIIDGEAVACADDGIPSFDRIRYRQHDADVFLYAFFIDPPAKANAVVHGRPDPCFTHSCPRVRPQNQPPFRSSTAPFPILQICRSRGALTKSQIHASTTHRRSCNHLSSWLNPAFSHLPIFANSMPRNLVSEITLQTRCPNRRLSRTACKSTAWLAVDKSPFLLIGHFCNSLRLSITVYFVN